LHFASSTYYDYKRREPSNRTLRDEELKVLITETYEANYSVYGAKKLWVALKQSWQRSGSLQESRDSCVNWAPRVPFGVKGSLSPPLGDESLERPKDLI